jgi:hypothetical protein
VDERHTEPLGKHPHVDLLLVTPLQWDAAVALTGSFGLDRPSGPALKFVGVELESFENQMVTFLPDILAEHPAPTLADCVPGKRAVAQDMSASAMPASMRP